MKYNHTVTSVLGSFVKIFRAISSSFSLLCVGVLGAETLTIGRYDVENTVNRKFNWRTVSDRATVDVRTRKWRLATREFSRMVVVIAVAFAVGPIPNAYATFIRSDVPVGEYAALTNQYPGISGPAGYILQGLGTSTLQPCSGTLVAQTLFLTAAHCVEGWQAHNLFVGFGTNYPPFTSPLSSNVAQITINPKYTTFPSQHDLAIVRLTNPAQGTPAPIITLNPENYLIAFEGYGAQGTSGNLLSQDFTPMPGANNGLMAFNSINEVTTSGYFTDVFNAPGSGALHFEGIGAPGDSGAGAFIPWINNGVLDYYLIGVLEGGIGTQIPTYGNIDFWSRVREPDNLAFLQGFPEIKIVKVNIPEPNSVMLIAIAIVSLAWCRCSNFRYPKKLR